MGRLIDANDVYNAIQITTDNFGVAKRVVEDNMLTMLSKIETVEAIPKADYKNRLKADMLSMLEELKEQLRKMHEDYFETEHFDEAYGLSDSIAIIQQKIDKLRGEQT